jgi:ribosomal protein S3
MGCISVKFIYIYQQTYDKKQYKILNTKDINYGFTEANTTYGKIGVKVWIYKGEVLPAVKREKKAEGGER